MDKYGCYRNDKIDFLQIKIELEKHGTIVFPYSRDGMGCMIIFLSINFTTLAVMPFGGNPTGRVYMGVWGRGCHHFAKEKTHWDYFQEKLKIPSVDAQGLEELWTELWGLN